MVRYKNVDYYQTTLIPVNFSDQILPGTFEYVLDRLKLIGGIVFAVADCKIPSNASKEWSGTFSDLEKKKEKFKQASRFLLEKHRKRCFCTHFFALLHTVWDVTA